MIGIKSFTFEERLNKRVHCNVLCRERGRDGKGRDRKREEEREIKDGQIREFKDKIETIDGKGSLVQIKGFKVSSKQS